MEQAELYSCIMVWISTSIISTLLDLAYQNFKGMILQRGKAKQSVVKSVLMLWLSASSSKSKSMPI